MLDHTIQINQQVRDNADSLRAALDDHLRKTFSPDAIKVLRSFGAGEAAELLGVSTSMLRKLHRTDRIDDVELNSGGRRRYTAEEISAIRDVLESSARTPGTYRRGRREGDKLQIFSNVNFKGGSGKTTTTIHTAQKLALKGYRILCLDIDPQASLTTLIGIRPERDLIDGGTIYDAIRYDDPIPMEHIVRATYFPGIDLAPGGLAVQEFEYDTPRALAGNVQPAFFTRLAAVIGEVEANYDVVLIDCPPQLGYLTLSALCASTGVLIAIVPNMLDVASMNQFLHMAADLLDTVAEAGAPMTFDFLHFLVNRFEPNDGPQQQIVNFLRHILGPQVMDAAILKSTAISDAGLSHQTVYEVERAQFNKATYDRAVESLDRVNDEIEALLQRAWGR